MDFIFKTWFWLTAYIPRPLPTNEDEYENFQQDLIQYFGLEDNDHVWITVASQIHATPPTSLYRSYGKIANAAKRLKVNAIAQDQKLLAVGNLEHKLKLKLEDMAKKAEDSGGATESADVQQGAYHSEGELPSMPLLKEGMV